MLQSNQVNELDLASGQVLGTFPSGGAEPGRSAVALDGSLWIANRSYSSPNDQRVSNVSSSMRVPTPVRQI